MKKSHYAFLIILLSVFQQLSYSQNKKIDSLKVLLNNAKQDTTRLRLYLALGDECDIKDNLLYAEPALTLVDKLITQTTNEKERKKLLRQKAYNFLFFSAYYQSKHDTTRWVEFNQKPLLIYQQLKDTALICRIYMQFGDFYRALGNLPKALDYFQKVLSTCEGSRYKKETARCLGEIGDMYSDQGDTTHALEIYERGLAIAHELNDENFLAGSFNKTGGLYNAIGNYSKALEYYNKGKVLYEKLKNRQGLREIYKNTGDTYKAKGDYGNALLSYGTALKMDEEIKDSSRIFQLLNRMGNTYRDMKDYNKALEYISQALKIAEKLNNESMKGWCYSSLARIYGTLKDCKKTKYYSDLALEIIKKDIQVMNIRDAEKFASRVDSFCGNFKEAYYHYYEYIILRDKLNSEEIRKTATKERLQKEYESKKAADKAEQDKKDALANAEKKKQQIIVWAVIAGLLLVLVFTGFVFRSLRVTRKQKHIIELKSKETEHQKEIIEEKNRDITDSINYAKRIQQAKLPKKEDILSALPNCFVLFKPKDIVSGDFYFFSRNNESIFIAAADCTGHGVPGAFMSMIGSERLEDAVSQSVDTSEILKQLNKGIKASLRQSDSAESTRDGMDIALCSVDTKNFTVKYAGANRPIWVIRAGQTEVEEIKATKKAIGGLTEDDQHFDTHELKLKQGDTFYISTDGYADTFSQNDKKLTTKKFKQILLEIQEKAMQDQEKHLDNFIEDWKRGIEQVDDILVVGVRL